MTDAQRLKLADIILSSDAASSAEDVLLLVGKGHVISQREINMANVICNLYKIIHTHEGCAHPGWEEENERLSSITK